MPVVVNLGSYQLWLVIIVIVFVVMYVIWGGKRNMEVVGLTPLHPPTERDYPVAQGYADPAQYYIRIPVVAEPSRNSPPNAHIVDVPRDPPPESSGLLNVPEDEHVSPRLAAQFGVRPEANPAPVRPVLAQTANNVTAAATRHPSIGEDLTIQAFESLLGRRVQRGVRPDYLKNPKTGRNLEYDGLDGLEMIAVEYNGGQHAEFTPRFHKSRKDFESQQYRDNEKIRLSAELGIALFVVPHTVDVCDPDPSRPSGYRYNPRITREERYERIYAYLAQKLANLRSVRGIRIVKPPTPEPAALQE